MQGYGHLNHQCRIDSTKRHNRRILGMELRAVEINRKGVKIAGIKQE